MDTPLMEPWQEGKTLSQSNGQLLSDGLYSDITFKVGEEEVKGHKLILSSRSPVFERLIHGSVRDADSGPVEVKDVSLNHFKSLLWYIYTDEIRLTESNKFAMCYAARKYMLDMLEEKCVIYIGESIKVQNFVETLNISLLLSLDDILERCTKFLQLYTSEILKATDVEDISRDSLRAMLSVNPVNCVTEIDLYKLAEGWAKFQLQPPEEEEEGEDEAETPVGDNEDEAATEPPSAKKPKLDAPETSGPTGQEIRSVLGDLFGLIRFPCMSPAEFTKLFAHSDMFSKDERLRIHEAPHLVDMDEEVEDDDDKSAGIYCTTPRDIRQRTLMRVLLQESEDMTYTRKRKSTYFEYGLTVMVSKDAWLAGIKINTTKLKNNGAYALTMTISNKDGNVLQSIKTNVAGGSTRHFEVKELFWKVPVCLSPQEVYKITINQTFAKETGEWSVMVGDLKVACEEKGVRVRVKNTSDTSDAFVNSIKSSVRELLMLEY